MATQKQIEKARSNTSAPSKESKARRGTHPAQILQRLEDAPASIRPADVLTLQRTIGNRATGRLLQAKLKLGPAGDAYEQEADQVAQQVVRASRQPATQAASAQREEIDDEMMQAKPLADGISRVQRTFVAPPPNFLKVQREDLEDEELQASPNHGLEGGDVDADVARSIQSAKGGGQPLHDGVRRSMERGFGADFGRVRVHTGSQADALNRSLNAKAFTTGKDIFFGKGQYNPGSTGGQELIAHELTHTVQQGAASAQRDVIQRVTNIQWNNATQAKPSTSGVKGGVFFVTVAGTMHVVKASDSVGATRFAEQLVGMLGGPNIQTTQSIPVPQSDNEHGAILAALNQLRPAQPQRNQFNTDQEFQEATDKYQAYITKYNQFQQSPYFLIQQNMFTPGTKVFGTEELMEDIVNAGNNKANLQGRVDTEVQEQVNLLTNATLMQAVGRMLAIDSLFGNADRFEEMNVQNAFMRGNNTIGAIDTEAIMQSMTGTTQFATTEIGAGSVPAGATNIIRYVDFVIGNNLTGGGRNISDDWNGTPSSNLAKFMSDTERDRWFRVTFVPKFVFRQDQMILTQYANLGFPQDPTQGNWPAVQQHIDTGFQAGVDAVKTLMTSGQFDQAKQNFQNLANQYGSTENFDWDAFRIRGDYMTAMKNGLSHQEARQSIIDRITKRENRKNNVGVPNKVVRVLQFGLNNQLTNAKEAMQIKKLIEQVSAKDLKDLLHISNRGGTTKGRQKLFSKDNAYVALESRLEAARMHQLKNLLSDTGTSNLGQAVRNGKDMASRLRSKDVDQVRYLTDGGKIKARQALAMIGVDVNRWGPN